MASDPRSSLREAAFQSFEAKFTRNGFSVPEGLTRLLREFTLKNSEEPDEARSRLYKRLWSLLWFGSNETLGGDVPQEKPTYVFPETLKNMVREIIPGVLVDRPDPTHMNVYKVNIGDFAVARWPVVKKKKKNH